MTVHLADAASGDEYKIAALLAEQDGFYGDQPEGTPAQRAEQVRTVLFSGVPAAYALLAWDGDELVGLASYSLLWPAAGLTTSLYLKELYITERHRRSGTGRALMNGLYRIASERGCSRVEWTTDGDNPGAQAFYESLSVKPKTSKIFYRADGDTIRVSPSQ